MAALNPGELSQNIQLGIEVVAILAFALSGIWWAPASGLMRWASAVWKDVRLPEWRN